MAYSDVILAETSLVNYYRFENAGSLGLDSKGTNNGSLSGSLSQTTAFIGSGYSLNLIPGSSGSINIARQIQDDFTIEFWIQTTVSAPSGSNYYQGLGLVSAEMPGATDDFGISMVNGGQIAAGTGNPDGAIVAGTVNDGLPHHIVLTRIRSSGTYTLYIDGTQVGQHTGQSTASLTAPGSIVIAAVALASGNFHDGQLDEIALYSSALTETDVGLHHSAMLAPTTDPYFLNVVLLCHADGASGSTTLVDSSNLAHALTTVSGSPALSTTHPKFGTAALDFTVSTSAVKVDYPFPRTEFDFGIGQFTVECWGYRSSLPAGTEALIGVWGNNNNTDLTFLLHLYNAPGLGFGYSIDGTTAIWTPGGNYTPPLNQWVHYAADRDAGGVIRVYANGVVIGNATDGRAFHAPSRVCEVGNNGFDTQGWIGQLDEIRITKGTARYAGAFTPPTAPFPDIVPPVSSQAMCVVMA